MHLHKKALSAILAAVMALSVISCCFADDMTAVMSPETETDNMGRACISCILPKYTASSDNGNVDLTHSVTLEVKLHTAGSASYLISSIDPSAILVTASKDDKFDNSVSLRATENGEISFFAEVHYTGIVEVISSDGINTLKLKFDADSYNKAELLELETEENTKAAVQEALKALAAAETCIHEFAAVQKECVLWDNQGNMLLKDGKLLQSKCNISSCSKCGFEYKKTEESCDHQYEYFYDSAATLGSVGYTMEKCSICGDQRVRPHSWVQMLECLEHSGGKATCTAGPICEVCGVQYGAPAGHTWAEATCTEPKTCTVCKKTEGSGLGHDYSKIEIIKEATCAQQGEEKQICTRCGDSVTAATISLVPHAWDDGKVTTEADCEKDGVRTFTCVVCKTTKTIAIPATGHSMSDFTVKKEPGCDTDGIKESVCSKCGRIEIESIPATGHTWTDTTEVVHHDAVTEDVKVVDTPAQDAWDEEKTVSGYRCTCGMEFSSAVEATAHANPYQNGKFDLSWSLSHISSPFSRPETVHHDAVPEVSHTEQRVVQEAYDETVTTGQHCSVCGIKK